MTLVAASSSSTSLVEAFVLRPCHERPRLAEPARHLSARVLSHPVGGQLDGLSERIARLDLTGHDGVRPHVDRMAEAVGYAAERVAASRPELVSTTMLDRLTGPLDQMSVPLDQFEAENNAAYLEQAATYCDALLGLTPGLVAR